jgi:hypothetical protein
LPKVIAIHRLTLNDEVDPGAFEQFVRSDVFPGLSVVFQVDKTLSHGLTKIDWLSSEHLLLRQGPQTDSAATYLWMISAPVADVQLSTLEGRRAVEEEAMDKAQSFFELGSTEDAIASVKLKPFAEWVSLQTYMVAAGPLNAARRPS